MENIDIVLPTYNGEKYIKQQINSIIKQDYKKWRILIRDDGSKDNTMQILNNYQNRFPTKIIIISDNKGNLGVTNNVFEILKHTSADYAMLCDQDDVWFENKVSTLYKCIKLKEKINPDIPILVHSEAIVVDDKLQSLTGDNELITNTYLTNTLSWDRNKSDFSHLLFKNVCQGASMILNAKSQKLLAKLHEKQINKELVHDSIIASIISINGKIFFYSKPLMFYRQHPGNLVGGIKQYKGAWLNMDREQKQKWRWANYLTINRTKCQLLLKYYKTDMTSNQIDTIEHFMKRPTQWIELFEMGLNKNFSVNELLKMIIFTVE